MHISLSDPVSHKNQGADLQLSASRKQQTLDKGRVPVKDDNDRPPSISPVNGLNLWNTDLKSAQILALQQSVGNQAVQRLLSRQHLPNLQQRQEHRPLLDIQPMVIQKQDRQGKLGEIVASRSVPLVIQRSGGTACSCGEEMPAIQRGILDDLGEGASEAIDTGWNLVRQIVQITGQSLQCSYRLVTLPSSLLVEILRSLRSGRPIEPSIVIENRAVLETVCDCLPDRVVAVLAREAYLYGKPLAQAHVDHYLTGGGADYPEDVATFIRTDSGVRGSLIRQIDEQGIVENTHGRGYTGDATIGQSDYQNQDYRMAFGNICCPDASGEPPGYLRYSVLDTPAARAQNASARNTAQVRILMHDHYAWHPQEARVTQCIHRAFENLKAHGAADFMEVGDATLDLPIDSSLIPT